MEQSLTHVADATASDNSQHHPLSFVDVIKSDAPAADKGAAAKNTGPAEMVTPKDVPAPAPAPPTDQPPAPASTPAPDQPPAPAPDQPPDPLPPVTDAPWLYVDFGKVYAGDNLKISFSKQGNNMIASGTMAYDKDHIYPFNVATDSYGTSRGDVRMDWTNSDGMHMTCPYPIEINYVSKELVNVFKPETIWTSLANNVDCPNNSEFSAWKLVKLSEYHEPPPPPPPPPKPPKPDKPAPKPKPHPKK